MPSRLDLQIETYHRNPSVLYRLHLGCIHQVVNQTICLHHKLLLVLALGITTSGGAQAAEQMPEGMKGWSYHIALNKVGFVRTLCLIGIA